jgi:hypothetical protein
MTRQKISAWWRLECDFSFLGRFFLAHVMILARPRLFFFFGVENQT